MRWTVVAAALAVVLPGCLWGGDARDESSTWHEPGLFDQLATEPAGYRLREERGGIAFPIADPAVAGEWHDPALIAFTNGSFSLSTGRRGDGGSYDLILADRPYEVRGGAPDREAFLSFARQVLVRSEEGYQALADEYEASFTGELRYGGEGERPYGDGVVVVEGPFRLEGILDGLGPVVTSPWSGVVFWREGGGWNVTYLAPTRFLQDDGFALKVGPKDVASFAYEGESNKEDVELVGRLAAFMADLGRKVPPGVTFSHSHGD